MEKSAIDIQECELYQRDSIKKWSMMKQEDGIYNLPGFGSVRKTSANYSNNKMGNVGDAGAYSRF